MNLTQVITFFQFLAEIRTLTSTTNGIGGLNLAVRREIKTRTPCPSSLCSSASVLQVPHRDIGVQSDHVR